MILVNDAEVMTTLLLEPFHSIAVELGIIDGLTPRPLIR